MPGHPAGARFAPVAFDFGYFKEAEAAERRIEASRELSALDEELREARLVGSTTLAFREEGTCRAARGGQPALEARLGGV